MTEDNVGKITRLTQVTVREERRQIQKKQDTEQEKKCKEGEADEDRQRE